MDISQGNVINTRLWRIEVQCVQWIGLLFNNIPIIQQMNRLSKRLSVDKKTT